MIIPPNARGFVKGDIVDIAWHTNVKRLERSIERACITQTPNVLVRDMKTTTRTDRGSKPLKSVLSTTATVHTDVPCGFADNV